MKFNRFGENLTPSNVQWGVITGYWHAFFTATYPIQFKKVFHVGLTFFNRNRSSNGGVGADNNDFVTEVTTTGFVVWNDNEDGNYWIAIGR